MKNKSDFDLDYALEFVTARPEAFREELKCKKISHFGDRGVAPLR